MSISRWFAAKLNHRSNPRMNGPRIKIFVFLLLPVLLCEWILASRVHSAQKWDVAFFWTAKLHHTLDYLEDIESVLGREIGSRLRIVKGPFGEFGIVYPVSKARPSAQRLITAYAHDLREAGLREASAVRHEGLYELFNVVYNTSNDLEIQKQNYKKIAKLLGMEVTKKLVIEKTDKGKFAIVYQGVEEVDNIRNLARSHQERLETYTESLPEKFTASLASAVNRRPVYGESSYLNDLVPSGTAGTGPSIVFSSPKSKELENRILQYISTLRTSGKIVDNERTSWSVFDFSSGERLVSINADTPRQTASMVKPLVALAFFHQAAEKKVMYDAVSKMHMERMIHWSDNVSTNWVMQRLGGPEKIDRLLNDHYRPILQTIRITDYIPLTSREKARARKMGLKGVPSGSSYYQNFASALDYSRFLFSLWRDELPYAGELRRIMALPNRDRVYHGAKKVPKGTLVYDKTGTTARLCGDMAILSAKGEDGVRYVYTLIGIIEKDRRASDYISWKNDRGDVIREVSNIVYSYQKQRYNLL